MSRPLPPCCTTTTAALLVCAVDVCVVSPDIAIAGGADDSDPDANDGSPGMAPLITLAANGTAWSGVITASVPCSLVGNPDLGKLAKNLPNRPAVPDANPLSSSSTPSSS